MSLGATALLEVYRSLALFYQIAEHLSGINVYAVVVTTVKQSLWGRRPSQKFIEGQRSYVRWQNAYQELTSTPLLLRVTKAYDPSNGLRSAELLASGRAGVVMWSCCGEVYSSYTRV